MDILTALFGSQTKVRLLRTFIFNQGTPFLVSEMANRTASSAKSVKYELNLLEKAGIIKKRQVSKDIQATKAKKIYTKKIKGTGYILDDKFEHLEILKNLLIVTTLKADEALLKRFANVGQVKFFVASGVFIQNWESRVDLLIVGSNLNLSKIEDVIRDIESEIGKEIAYSAFETADFEYRYGIHDRLIRDILDNPHATLLDRMSIEPQ